MACGVYGGVCGSVWQRWAGERRLPEGASWQLGLRGTVPMSHPPRRAPTASPPPQVANEIWVVDKGTVSKWDGDIVSYKEHLRKQHAALSKRDDLT